MFEFSRDLRRLFEKARDSVDLGWLEVISTILLENEARQQSVESGRVSCTQPYQASLRGCLLWREHARRTGNPQSLDRSEAEARNASRLASNEDQSIRAVVELAQSGLLAFDLTGGPDRLSATEDLLNTLPKPRRAHLIEIVSAVQARLAARRALLDGAPEALQQACEGLEKAVHNLKNQQTTADTELRIEQASLSLELGIATRDLKRLDKVGQDLRTLVEDSPSEQRPLTRARALALCGVGMLALSKLAKDDRARNQGHSLLNAAVDQFTMDHSPLDWAAIQLMRFESTDNHPLITMVQVEALTEEFGLIMGAEAREHRLRHEIFQAETDHDLIGLKQLENRVLSRLRKSTTPIAPLDWVSNQIGLAQIALARSRLTGQGLGEVGMILIEAAATARELGAIGLADRARSLLPHPQPV